ncbi:MAG TPA: ABC transporter ATP-binding protein [Acidobacteriota bacterium]|nr:ABC transporter ATP-binding protein [Acidobacteriota bacterium]
MLKTLLRRISGSPANQVMEEFFQPRDGTPLIHLESIAKVYVSGNGEVRTQALREVDLEIERGEFVTVAGPSGCGKSTLLHIIGLLETPSTGTYTLNGNPVAGLKPQQMAFIRNKCVGFIFQNFNLIGDLTVYENVETPLTYLKMASDERRDRVMEALSKVGMEKFARRYPGQITGGEQQRVGVARAVVADPLILLADEPTGNLDSKNGESVMSLLQDLHSKGATLFLVTHNPDYARRSDRTVKLFDGETSD